MASSWPTKTRHTDHDVLSVVLDRMDRAGATAVPIPQRDLVLDCAVTSRTTVRASLARLQDAGLLCVDPTYRPGTTDTANTIRLPPRFTSPTPQTVDMAALRTDVAALGQELVRMHDELRSELRVLQETAASGRRPERDARPLLAHCAAFCSALTRHHTAKDARAFPALADQFPDLAPLIGKLEDDHQLIGMIVGRIEEAAARLSDAPTGDVSRLAGELDGLAAILESHFAFEERRIVQALDRLRTDAPVAELFGVRVDAWRENGV